MPPGYLLVAGAYYMIESGSCGGGVISTASECNAAATALDLSDTTSSDQTGSHYSSVPPGCHFYNNFYLYVYGSGSSGSCSSIRRCICMFTPPSPPTPPPEPPSPPSPPSSPPMPPGFLQIAGGYYAIESGSCGSAIIETTSECNAAATALDLSDKTSSDYVEHELVLSAGLPYLLRVLLLPLRLRQR